ncbi:bifunctional ADP-dependent NAD(P)H-hydrate dehydratase/NAD(P)H-hydrate epimerase [Francisella philomiragia]|uniref:Bifunctional NAD(P)H-hydrate repair enzyme n=1 Tax=Francisella philomiragia subsp. philomiragia (strain ATCC 25017 / CCUG 19701 / FSC 153 / O\|nr:bifunctional ADP-dependent NAD(P)H-hydrate dehydratase/NAD(P)H-hydrate epimerase [Francisella philomiragia]AJI48022.1 hydroxyethylthiazole kinase family protein [Francisella philomiragia]AJI48903.1 hydroxyethylthiazole kinase family protein [Francisella philomiragia]MBK2021190.1 bifunctional ADP-dependent NAD(P)H-hydrate dehydratase/NAD(P)H-hydrate epimerase [Francisella philomiragia]MBK2030756.1 bifunctional ADP-dependent NAD(P)H-hydrate dehydratase/NAD(P)H-hydrate epimerase [Francisella ph
MQFLTEKQNREIEEYAISQGLNLIENASDEIVKLICNKFDKQSKILVIAGSGNNGSDGIAAAIKLFSLGYDVDVYRVFPKGNPDNQNYYQEFLKLKTPLDKLPDINNYDVVIDGIFGIGLDRDLQGDILELVKVINQNSKYTLAIDVPSGLGAFNAKVYGEAIQANETITFLADKQGLHTGDGLDYAGKVTVKELINSESIKLSQSEYQVYKKHIKDINLDNILRKRKNTNKGTYGNLAIIGGNVGMNGALQLAGKSSLYSGCGKVSMISLDKDFRADMSTPELMTKSLEDIPKNLNTFLALVVGVGFDTTDDSRQVLQLIIDNLTQSAIFDADALNIISTNQQIREKFIQLENKIITPHPAEAARLLGCTTKEVQDDRFVAVRALAKKYNSTVVLKGAGSLICKSDEIYINATGNQGMAVAGQGDVLSGIIGAFLAQDLDTLSASRLAVYVHGLAGDNIVKKLGGYVGIFPSRVAEEVCEVLNFLN